MLQAHTVKPAKNSRRTKTRVGRGNGSGLGTTAGRGTKGQKARAGGSGGLKRIGYKMILQRIPKRRGFTRVKPETIALTLAKLNTTFSDNEKVTKEKLVKRGLLTPTQQAKIVATGGIEKKLIVVGIQASAQAKEAIEKAGGSFEAAKSAQPKK